MRRHDQLVGLLVVLPSVGDLIGLLEEKGMNKGEKDCEPEERGFGEDSDVGKLKHETNGGWGENRVHFGDLVKKFFQCNDTITYRHNAVFVFVVTAAAAVAGGSFTSSTNFFFAPSSPQLLLQILIMAKLYTCIVEKEEQQEQTDSTSGATFLTGGGVFASSNAITELRPGP